ncbi:MAG: hypothetical protein U9R55_05000 [Pseudomonadota bacterium]|nr:hypothetical protein [Pseudomonadota bacterium]
MSHQIPSSYEALLAEALPKLDELFAKRNRPVHERPFEAARFIVDHMVVEVSGDTKDDYLSKPWFAGIYLPVIRWYEQRYGTELPHPKYPSAHGLVSHFGALYTLRVEFVISDEDQDGHRWVRFPKEVLPAEEPLDWLASPPPLCTLKPNRREALASTSRHVANRLRCINNDLNTATYPSDTVRRMATSVIRHLDKAALDATSLSHDAHALVPWELQMACEKTMKVYLTQSKLAFPEVHDLRSLNRLAEPTLNWFEGSRSLAAFPTAARVLKWRYGELTPPTATDIWRMYGAVIELVHGYASRMERKYTFNNFAVQLKKAPWH